MKQTKKLNSTSKKKRTARSDAEEDIARQQGLEGALKNVPPNRIEQRKADYLKHYKTERQRIDESIQQTETYYNSMLNPLTDELSKESDTELQQPAIVDNSSSIFHGFTTDEKGGRMMVVVNTDYFKLNLPRYTSQMIVLYWSWDKNAPCQDFKKQLEDNFPLDQLKAMIDK